MKEEKGMAHLASTHSKIGLLTLMLSFASFCIAMRRTANLKKLTAPKWVWGDWLHKQLGVATYVVGAVAGANGLYVSKWGNGVLGFPLVYVLCALGANVAAAWTHREWLPCILLGWYAGGAYWDFLGVRPPPSFTGIPITIEKTRLGIASTQKSPP